MLADPQMALRAHDLNLPGKVNVTAGEQVPGTLSFIISSRPTPNDGTPTSQLRATLTADPEFKARFIAHPRQVVAERGIFFPETLTLKIIVDMPAEMTIAVPEAASHRRELSEADGRLLVGGVGSSTGAAGGLAATGGIGLGRKIEGGAEPGADPPDAATGATGGGDGVEDFGDEVHALEGGY